MSENFTTTYINCDHQQVVWRLANTMYLRVSISKYSKYTSHQYFKVLTNQFCIAIELLTGVAQYNTLRLTRQQQVLRTDRR